MDLLSNSVLFSSDETKDKILEKSSKKEIDSSYNTRNTTVDTRRNPEPSKIEFITNEELLNSILIKFYNYICSFKFIKTNYEFQRDLIKILDVKGVISYLEFIGENESKRTESFYHTILNHYNIDSSLINEEEKTQLIKYINCIVLIVFQ